MSGESLRELVITQERPRCQNGIPGAQAIADYLVSLSGWILTDNPNYYNEALELFRYTDILALQTDFMALAISLKSELSADDWDVYFKELLKKSK